MRGGPGVFRSDGDDEKSSSAAGWMQADGGAQTKVGGKRKGQFSGGRGGGLNHAQYRSGTGHTTTSHTSSTTHGTTSHPGLNARGRNTSPAGGIGTRAGGKPPSSPRLREAARLSADVQAAKKAEDNPYRYYCFC